MSESPSRSAAGSDGAGPSRGQLVGWTLLAWLAGLGAVPFTSAAATLLSQGLDLPETPVGTFALALVCALVAWVAGRVGTPPRHRFLVGTAFVPLIHLINVVAFQVLLPLPVIAGQMVVGAIGAGTMVALGERRARLREADGR